MNTETIEHTSKVRLYACGGAGCNVSKTMEPFRNNKISGFSSLETVYIDTSGSDFDDVPQEFIYRFKDKDGSGALRKESYSVITKHAKEIIQDYKPLDLNIVISSASGGSGSVLSPTIVGELLRQNQNVVVILIGAVDTVIYMNNTLNTLKSFENISKTNEKSIVMKYIQNESSSKRQSADEQARFLISGLCMLFSGTNKGLDSKDLNHWINFNKVTSFEPQLASLETVTSLDAIKTKGNVISVASLASLGGDTDLEYPVEVQFIGYVPDDTPKESSEKLPIHFVTTDGLFEELGKNLNSLIDEMDALAKSRVQRDSLLTDDDEPTESGLIL